MTGEWVAIITLLIVIVFLCVMLVLQKLDFNKIQGLMLDRIMTRNYETYVQAEVLRKANEKDLTSDESSGYGQERGIPVI